MAIRERLRKRFSPKNKDSSTEPRKSDSSTETYYTGRKDIEYYKPHEIPRPKFRGLVDPAHRDRLEAYSLADACAVPTKRSSQAMSGVMSPGGTNAQSRRTSVVSSHTTTDEEQPGDVSTRQSLVVPVHRPTSSGVSRVDENSDDDTDIANTGLSRRPSLVRTVAAPLPPPTAELRSAHIRPTTTFFDDVDTDVDADSDTADSDHLTDPRESGSTLVGDTEVESVSSLDGQPFTAEELEKAMMRTSFRNSSTHTSNHIIPTSNSMSTAPPPTTLVH